MTKVEDRKYKIRIPKAWRVKIEECVVQFRKAKGGEGGTRGYRAHVVGQLL